MRGLGEGFPSSHSVFSVNPSLFLIPDTPMIPYTGSMNGNVRFNLNHQN